MFKVNDKVICIDDSNGFNVKIQRKVPLILNKLYTITFIGNKFINGKDEEDIEIEVDNIKIYFSSTRFRKVEEQDFGSLVLENIKQKIKEEELVELC